MEDRELLERITINPEVMTGKLVIKGTRPTVGYILNLLENDATSNEIMDEYAGLVAEDIQACLLFASKSLEDNTFVPLLTSSE